MMYENCTSKKELLQFIQKKKELLNITVSFQPEEMSSWKNMQNFMDR